MFYVNRTHSLYDNCYHFNSLLFQLRQTIVITYQYYYKGERFHLSNHELECRSLSEKLCLEPDVVGLFFVFVVSNHLNPPGAEKKVGCTWGRNRNIEGAAQAPCAGCRAEREARRYRSSHAASLLGRATRFILDFSPVPREPPTISPVVSRSQCTKSFLILFEVWFEKSVTIKVNELFY